MITVAATGHTGSRAYYSNYGTSVEIAAPGGDAQLGKTILSTLNAGTTTPRSPGDSYANYQGTSMATPHVVGVVSLMLSVNPSLTPAQVTSMLQATATPFPAGSTCTTSTCGAGHRERCRGRRAGERRWRADTARRVREDRARPTWRRSPERRRRCSGAASSGAASYAYCVDTTADIGCCDRLAQHRRRDVGTVSGLSSRHDVLLAGAGDERGGRHRRGRRRLVDVLDPGRAALPGAFSKLSPSNGQTNRSQARHADVGCELRRDLVRVVRLARRADPARRGRRRRRTSASVGGLAPRKTYYWQVRARNGGGTTDANGGTWWSFRTR